MPSLGLVYLESVTKRLLTYRQLGDATFAQLQEEDFYFVPAPSGNSIAVIIHHLHGNMLSRWTNFLTEDGEKAGRNRDVEFSPPSGGKEELIALWDKGWNCLLDTLRSLTEADLLATITIRHEPLMAIDAINRQLAHYPYHVGQIVYIGKMIRGDSWQSLSIPRGASQQFNREMEGRHGR